MINSKTNWGVAFSSFRITSFFIRLLPIILTLYILFRISLNLINESLWYDEAMQFWISFGCNPDQIKINNGLDEVIDLNQKFNHDPGGFSLLLHFWLNISQELKWIRLLPLLFFLGSIIVVFLTIQSLFKDKRISFICALIPFLSDTLLYFSTEIRAYSMECLCSSFAILAICTLNQQKSLCKILLCSIMLSFLMTSRYSAMITSALSMIVIISSWSTKLRPNFFVRVSFMIIPFILIASTAYLFSLSLQNPSIKTPSYVDLSFEFNILNLIIFFIPLGCIVFFDRSDDRRIFYVSIYVTLLNLTFVALALLEIHPADLWSKYCVGLLFGNIVLYIIVFAKVLSSNNDQKWSSIFLAVLALGILLQHNSLSMRANQNFFDPQELCKLSGKKIYVDRSLSPTLKYLTTFGSATKWKTLEENEIFFQKQNYHTLGSDRLFLRNDNIEKLDLSPYDLLITSESIINDDISSWVKVSNYVYQKN